MRLPPCPVCTAPVHPHTLVCSCGAALLHDPLSGNFTLNGIECANRRTISCNWQADVDSTQCLSCNMTHTVPDLSVAENTPLWGETERAKRLALDGFLRLGWFTSADPGPRPVFHLLSEQIANDGSVAVVMAHGDGEVTLNVAEADPATRAIRARDLGEQFRSMVGHIRHEMGHFVFWRLAQNPDFLLAFRALFGDETTDYGQALSAHHASPRPADADHVSSYATAHPHEDWAESFAHMMHLLDLADSFEAAGLRTSGEEYAVPAYDMEDAEALLHRAGDVAIALNHLTLGMGLPLAWPLVLGPGVRVKMGFVHRWMTGRQTAP